jgi:lysophospholipase L1-like esterase
MVDDVLAKKPDVIFVYVGINDVWHKTLLGTGTDKDKFEKFYRALIHRLQAKSIQVVICTTILIGEKSDGSNLQDAELDAYSDVIRQLAKEEICELVNLRAAFMNYLNFNNLANKESGLLIYDRVYLTDQGNQMVASQFLGRILSKTRP